MNAASCLAALIFAASSLCAATSDLWGKAGERWTPSSPLPDFSFAGCREIKLPAARVSVKDFGARGDGITDDTDAVLRAVAAAPGKVISFPAGRYLVTKLVQVTRSGTVLRGEGVERTTLLMPVPMNIIAPRVFKGAEGVETTAYSWSGGMISLAGRGYIGETLTTIAAPAKRGDTTLSVTDTSKLAAGTRVVLDLADDSARTLLGHVYRGDSGDISKERKVFSLKQTLTVVKLDGQAVTFDRPLRTDVNLEWTPQLKRYEPTLENCGVENLTIEFPAGNPYRGHWMEDGFNPVEIRGAAECWLRNLRIANPDSGPFISDSVFCTIDGIELTSRRKSAAKEKDIQGHHGISLMGVDCLCRNFTIGMKFFHDLTVSHGSSGNVFSNGSAVDLAIDHHRHAPYENLFTQINAGPGTRLWSSGGTSGEGKHTAAGAVFWNIKSRNEVGLPPPDFAPDGGLVIAGLKVRARKSELGRNHIESISPGSLEPPDLYEAQRARRAGPAAPGSAMLQTWTGTNGRSIRAAFVRIEGANVILKVNGQPASVPLSNLAPAGIAQARELEKLRQAP